MENNEKSLIEAAETAVYGVPKILNTVDDYTFAAEKLREIKATESKVKDYWKAPKEAAAKAHKDICAKEKEMLKPLEAAEKSIKESMQKYNEIQEQLRLKAIEEEKARQREEADRLLNEAIQNELNGDCIGSEQGLAMAEIVSDMEAVAAPAEAPKADGIAAAKVWKARVIEPESVPAYANGIEIREIRQSALDQLAKLTKGTAKIPGVEFYQEYRISAKK